MRGRDREHAAIVGARHLPAALMHLPVMAVAQEHQVLKIGFSAMPPVEDVVGVKVKSPVVV
jgi:hypothetical protein